MKLYGIENHYEQTGLSDKTELFKTFDDAVKRFIEIYHRCASDTDADDGIIRTDDGEEYTLKRAIAEREFYYIYCDSYDLYRIVEYEI